VDASNATYLNVASDPRAGPEYRLGAQLIRYLHDAGYKSDLPYFWYNVTERNWEYRGLQSLYYFGYTYIAGDMPVINKTFRLRMKTLDPKKLVLLCSEPSCAGAGAKLARAGYHSKELVRRRLASGGEHVWVVIRTIRPVQA
jgi:hypothetical protein